jgi:mRNA deadenylase 3'-5' endonuclease subunit Ccr4
MLHRVKDDATFETIDFVFFTPNTFDVKLPLTEEQQTTMVDQFGLPNAWNPSDHLPVAALFEFKK